MMKLGTPKKVLSDQGRQYISEDFRKYLTSNNIDHITTIAYNPSGNSISERLNKTITEVCHIYKGFSVFNLKGFIETRQYETYHRILSATPSEIINNYASIDPLKRELKHIELKVKEKLMHKSNNQKSNKLRKRHTYRVGDLVFKRLHNPDKIHNLYSGPFKILAISKDGNVITIDEISKISRQNIKNITPFLSKRGGRCRAPTWRI
ncbi:Pro-Pol polyprotein [Dictyocoela muelleri]|nr:Pro-Pol polyprotein [Dictyocoela muelleri]